MRMACESCSFVRHFGLRVDCIAYGAACCLIGALRAGALLNASMFVQCKYIVHMYKHSNYHSLINPYKTKR